MTKRKRMPHKITAATLSSVVAISSLPTTVAFGSTHDLIDLKESNSHTENIIELLNRGVVSGYEDKTYRPNAHITRAQASKIIANILNLDLQNVKDPQFKDVSKTNSYYHYIAALAEEGIIHGDNGQYKPNAFVTRGQMAKIISRAFQLEEIESIEDTAFTDVAPTHQYAKYVNTLAKHNITIGKEDGRFDLQGFVTRGQMASFVVRAEKATRQQQVSGHIEAFTQNTVTIDGTQYTVSTDSFLLLSVNKEALTNAEITISTKDNQVTAIHELTLQAADSFDGKNEKIALLNVPSGYTSVANIQTDELNIHESSTSLTIKNASAINAFLHANNARTASTTPVASNADVTFEDSRITTFTSEATSTIQTTNTVIEHAIFNEEIVHVNGAYKKVTVQNNVRLTGNASIEVIEISSTNNEAPSLQIDSSVNIANISVAIAGIVMSLEEAISSNFVSVNKTNSPDVDNNSSNGATNSNGNSSSNGSTSNNIVGNGNASNNNSSDDNSTNVESPSTPDEESNTDNNESDDDSANTDKPSTPDEETNTDNNESDDNSANVENPSTPDEESNTDHNESDDNSANVENPSTPDEESNTDNNESDDNSANVENPSTPDEEQSNNENNESDDNTSTEEDLENEDEVLPPLEDTITPVESDAIQVNDDGDVIIHIDGHEVGVQDREVASFLSSLPSDAIQALDVIIENNEIVGIEQMSINTNDAQLIDGNFIAVNNLTVEGDVTNLSNITVNNALTINRSTTEPQALSFSNVDALGAVEVNGAVSVVNGLTVQQSLTINGAQDVVTLENISTTNGGTVSIPQAKEIIVAEPMQQAMASLRTFAARTFANVVADFTITFANTSASVLTVKRNSATVDIQSNVSFDAITFEGNFATLQAEIPLTNVFVGANVTNILLNTNVQQLDLIVTDQTKPIVIKGTGQIETLNVNKQGVPTDYIGILIDINGININTVSGVNRDDIIFKVKEVTTNTLQLNGASFGKYSLELITNSSNANPPTITSYVQLGTGERVEDGVRQNYTPGDVFVLYDSTSKIIATASDNSQYTLDIPERYEHTLLSKYSRSELTFLSTFKPGSNLADTLKYLVLFEYGEVSNTATDLSNYTWELDSVTGLSKVTIPIKNNFSKEFMILTDGQVDDYTSSEVYKVNAIKEIAKLAKAQSNPAMLYGPLVKFALIQNVQFDSLLLEKYANAIVNNGTTLTTLDSIKNVLDQVEAETPYAQEFVLTPDEVYLNNASITFEYSNPAIVRTEIQSGKILFIPLSDGDSTIKMTDSLGNTSIVNVTVANGTLQAPEVAKHVLPTNHSVIVGAENVRIVGNEVLATSLANATFITQNATTMTELQKVTFSPTSGTVQAQVDTLAVQSVTPAQLGFSATPNVIANDTVGSFVYDNKLHFYAIQDGIANFVYENGSNQTAVQVTSASNVVTPVVAKSLAPALGLGTIDIAKVEAATSTATIHAAMENSALTFFAGDAGTNSFKVTDVSNKTSLVNVEATKDNSGKVTVAATAVTTALPTSATEPIVHVSNSNIHHKDGTIYASAIGETIITLKDGKQYRVEVTHEDDGYTISTPELIKNIAILPTMVDLPTIDGPTGVSYASIVEGMFIVKLPDGVTEQEIILTSGTDPTQKAVVLVKKDPDTGTHSAEYVRCIIEPAELGFDSITSISGSATSSHRAVLSGDNVHVYGFGTTGGSYKVTGTKGSDTVTAYINITPTYTGGKHEVTAKAAMLEMDSALTLDTTATSSNVRIDGNKLYALAEGYVELPLSDGTYYTFTISKDSNDHYVFSTPVIISRQSYTPEELGLSTATTAISNNTAVATVKVDDNNNIIISSGTQNGTARITVNGMQNGATVLTNIFVTRAGNMLTTQVEELNAHDDTKTNEVSFADFGHTTLTTNVDWLTTGIIRPVFDGTNVKFFVIGEGNTAAKFTSNVTTLVNFTTAGTTVSFRTVTAEAIKTTYTAAPTIISGSDVVRVKGNDVYATATGTAIVKADGKLYEITVGTDTNGKQYTMSSSELANALTVSANSLGLSTSDVLSATAVDSSIVSILRNGNDVIMTPKAAGKTAVIIETATGKSVINVTSTSTTDAPTATAAIKTTAISPSLLNTAHKDIVRIDGNDVYAVGEGTALLLATDSNGKKVIQSVTVTKDANNQFTISAPATISDIVLTAADLGLGNTLSLAASEHAGSMVEATIKDETLIAYGLANGETNLVVKDSTGKKTLVQVKQTGGTFTGKIAKMTDVSVTDADATDLSLTEVNGLSRIDGTTLYLLEAGNTYGTFTDGTVKSLANIKIAADADGWLSATATKIEKTATNFGGAADTTFTAMPNNGTNSDVVRISADKKTLIATGLGTTQVQMGGDIVSVTVAKDDTNKIVVTHSVTSSKIVTAADAGLTAITAFTDLTGNSLVTGVANGNDYIFYAKPGVSNATAQLQVTDGTNTAIVNVQIDGNGKLTKADVVKATVDAPTITTAEEKKTTSGNVRAVWNGNKVTLYATDATAEKATIAFSEATMNVQLSSTAGAYTVTGEFVYKEIPNGTYETINDAASIFTVDGKTYAYAKAVGQSLLKSDTALVIVNVSTSDNHLAITTSDSLTFATLPIGTSTYTVANVEGTTVQTHKDDTDVLLYSDQDGKSDVLITDGTTKTLHHVTTTNDVTTVKEASEALTYTNATITSGTAARVANNKVYFLEEGNVTLQADEGLFNGVVSRNSNQEFEVAWTQVTKTTKEAVTLGNTSSFTATGTTLQAKTVSTSEETFYTTKYRVTAKTTLNTTTHQYELAFTESPMAKDNATARGLTGTITATSTDSSKLKVEVVNNEVIVYAVTEDAVQETITVTNGTKTYSLFASFDGTNVTLEVAGTEVPYADLGLTGVDKTKVAFTATNTANAPVDVQATDSGIAFTATKTGETAITVSYDGQVVGIINVTVAQGGSTPLATTAQVVKAPLVAATGTVINGNVNAVMKAGNIIGEGTVLYKTSNTSATLVTVTKQPNGLYYVNEKVVNLAAITATSLELTDLTNVQVLAQNDTVVQAVVSGDTIYVYGQNAGTTKLFIQNTATNKLLATAKVDATTSAITPTVATAAAPTDFTGTWTDTEHVAVRNGKLFFLNEGTSTLKLAAGTHTVLYTAVVTTTAGNFTTTVNAVKETVDTAATIVSGSDIVYKDGTNLYAQKAGTAQIVQNGVLTNVTVTALPNGTFEMELEENPAPQLVVNLADVDLTSFIPTVFNSVVETTVANVDTDTDQELVITALQPGDATIELKDSAGNKAYVYVKVIMVDGKLQFDGLVNAQVDERVTIAKAELENVTFTSNEFVRAAGDTLYALKAGATVINGSDTAGKALYKVLVTEQNGKLSVSTPAKIETAAFGQAPVPVDPTVARVEGTKLVALQLDATTNFTVGSTTYRLTIDEAGNIDVTTLQEEVIDVSTIFTENITSVSESTFFTTETNGQQVTVTPTTAGTDVLEITVDSKKVLAKVVVTGTEGNLTATATLLKSTILGTDLGFYVTNTTLPTLTNAIVRNVNGNLDIYPSTTTAGKEQFIVTDGAGKQAIYELTITAPGEFTVQPLSSTTAINTELIDIVPTNIFAVHGTAKARIEGNNLHVTYFDTTTSYVLVKDANNNVRVIDVVATGTAPNITPNAITSANVSDALVQTTPIDYATTNLKIATDGSLHALYVTDAATKGSFATNNKLYNVTMSNRDITAATAVSETAGTATSATFLHGDDVASIESSSKTWFASKEGTGYYRTNEGEYVQVVVEQDNDGHYSIVSTPLTKHDYAGLTNITILEPTTGVFVDGTTVYGTDPTSGSVIFKALQDGKAVMYTGNTIATLSVLSIDLNTEFGWTDPVMSAPDLANSTQARLDGTKLYITDFSDTPLTTKVSGESGIYRDIEVNLKKADVLDKNNTDKLEELVSTGLDTINYAVDGLGDSRLLITFSENVVFDEANVYNEFATINATAMVNENQDNQTTGLMITTSANLLTASNIILQVPEWASTKTVNISLVYSDGKWSTTITDAATTATVMLLEK